jgi:hypothetical protein
MHTAELRDEDLSEILHPDILQQWLGEFRAGAESARAVAIELDRAAEHLSKVPATLAAVTPAAVASIIELSGQNASNPALPSAMSDDELRAKLACLPQDAREAMIGFVNHILAKCSS